MTASSACRLVRHQVTFMLPKTAELFLLIIVEAPGNIPGVLILFEGGNPVRVTGISPVKLDLPHQIRCLLDRYRNISIQTEPGVQT